jgi:MFS family permease
MAGHNRACPTAAGEANDACRAPARVVTPETFSLRRIALPVYAPSFLFGLGEGAILPVIPLSVRELGGSVALAALVVTLIGIGSLVSNIPASIVTTRWGERWAIVGAALWSALAMLLCLTVPDLRVFAAGIFMIGMSASVFGLARQKYLTEAVPVRMRARALSLLGGVMRIGMFVGPFIAAAVIHYAGIGGAYAVGLVALLAAVFIAARIPELVHHAAAGLPQHAPTLRGIAREHLSTFATVGIGVLLVSAVRASRQVVIPLWADHLGLAAATASVIYGLAAGIDMLVFYPAGKLMDRKGRNWVAVPSMIIMGLAMMLMPLAHGTVALLVAALLIGFGNGIGSGMIMTLGADYSPSAGRAHFLGIWRLLADIGSSSGPALLSALTAALSLAAGIAATGLIGLAAAGVLWYWIPRTNARRVHPGPS